MLIALVEGKNQDKEEVTEVVRNSVGNGIQEIPLLLDIENHIEGYDYQLRVEEKRVTEKEAVQLFEQAAEELETIILGKNESLEEIVHDLYLPSNLVDGKVEVSYYFEPYECVDTDGKILWDNVSVENTLIKVVANLFCQEWEGSHEFYIQLAPQRLAEEEQILQKIKRVLYKENEKYGNNSLCLPKEVDGIALRWYEEQESLHTKILLLGIIGVVSWYVYEKEKAEKKRKDREWKLRRDYPDIVSQLSLLSGAGMTISAAWGKMVHEYAEGRKCGRFSERPGYEEMLHSWNEMQDGVSEKSAYENFGRRCNQSTYRKFSSLLVQNLRKGTKGMQQLLDAEATEALLERKLYARKMGEEAGTKLLLPMGLMLVVVFAVLMVPAMLSFNM